MDFAGLPPEVNSARMYAGAGSGPLVMAAASWSRLAAELGSAATSYRATLSALTSGPWVGPSSGAMAAAAVPYVSWMNATAAQAGQTASQLGSAVAAYEAAFAATVPPAEIEVNRALLASLVATNILGQNTPAIAATEAQYAEMWAQDAAAMYSYAAASATATTLTAFTSPPQTTDPAGTTTQGAAAATTATGSSTQSALSSVPNLLQGLSAGSVSGSNPILDLLNSYPIQTFNQFSTLLEGYEILSEGLNFDASGLCLTIAPPIAAFWNPVVSALSAPVTAASTVSPGVGDGLAAGLGSPALVGSPTPAAGLGGAGMSAGLGRAASVGTLSVPQTWGTSPAIRLAATALPAAGLDGAAQAGPGGFYGMPPMGPVASVVNAPRGDQGRLRAGARHKVIPALAGEPGMDDDAAARWVAPGASADGAVAERDELNQLRKAIADVTRQRDVLKRTAATLIKEAAQK
ncbi:PPE domain-containing protein [Mycobacterium heidelbergense]|uniref:PPE family protein n=1 Tax=Mycobacterium heidelbergense TaxID=53376 RepID=A0A1X0DF37_MYCHE|nr:PPE domain-containing protein [Mycobacterium heidelbergense]ORA71016.1 PPE family protein [Mycobacterium heidelbergense]